MARALAIAAALALAACSVEVEGAGCRVPGAAEDCPSGQACGNDLRCSARALACEAAATRCAPGTTRCAGATGRERAERCGDADPACGAWQVDDCEAAGLECGTRSGAAACECPAYGDSTFHADPVAGSPAGATPFPTGAPAPPACRFARLGDALAAASAVAAGGAAASVQAMGEAGSPVVFGDVLTGEAFPLRVDAGVTLAGAAEPAGPTVVLARGPTAEPLARVEGTIARLRLESAPAAPGAEGILGATGAGIAAACGARGAPSIEDVRVEGGGTLAAGIDVAGGACGASISGAVVSHVDGPALSVEANAGVAVTVTGSRLEDSAVGIRAAGGKLTVGSATETEDAVEVSGNAGDGIVLTGGPTRTLDVALLGVRVEGNGGTGVVLDVVKSDSALTVRGCTVYSNGATAPWVYGPDFSQRAAGGVLVRQVSLSGFVFERNRVSSNAGDQLGFESSGAWSISTGACPVANLFACVAEGAYAVGVAGGGTVDASYTVWPGIPWAAYASPGVTAPTSNYCNGAEGAPEPPAPSSCPAP